MQWALAVEAVPPLCVGVYIYIYNSFPPIFVCGAVFALPVLAGIDELFHHMAACERETDLFPSIRSVWWCLSLARRRQSVSYPSQSLSS